MSAPAPAARQPRGLLRATWRGVLLFLEIIGLRRERGGTDAEDLARFRLVHAELRNLLSANDRFLRTLAELEEALYAHGCFDTLFVKRRAVRALADVHRMASSLATICGHTIPSLTAAVTRVGAALTATVDDALAPLPTRLVLDLTEISARHAEAVGGKMANLGEVWNAVGLPTPDGFAVTTDGHHTLLQAVDPGAPGSASADLIRATPVPEPLAAAILEAYDRLAQRLGHDPRVAVRSSALGEDGTRSFAGQFLTVLGVNRAGLLDAYRQVVASLFSNQADHYRRLHAVPEEAAAMAVGVVAMVDAAASGIAYSRHPSAPEHLLIHGVRGLGAALADGASPDEVIVLDRNPQLRVIDRRRSAPPTGQTPGLTDEEAGALARWLLVLESHFGCPQDVEWCLDAARKLVILQARPLSLPALVQRAPLAGEGIVVVLRGGETACGGAGAGTAVHLDAGGDLESFPAGAVLVSPRPSPRFVQVMARTRAIVTDAGSVTGHMAAVARELGVPTLLGAHGATRCIAPGTTVTVDATARVVYAGDVIGRIRSEVARAAGTPLTPATRETPARRLLERVAAHMVPLTLTDPRAPSFAPEHCTTLHDIARYVHERSYEEMFRLGERLGDVEAAGYVLDVFLPIDLHLIDLGGGVRPPARGRKVAPEAVTSVPLAAMLRGMLDRRLPRFGPRPIDIGGIVAVMMRHALTSPEHDRTFRDPCYAMVSDLYLNYTARVGYHFGVVDTYCSPVPNRNYISFRFKGGAADRVRRSRRARAIAAVLRRHAFTVEVSHDMVSARLSKTDQGETAEKLETLGRLLQFFRQMDAAMTSEDSVEELSEAFLRDDFRLERSRGAPAGGAPM